MNQSIELSFTSKNDFFQYCKKVEKEIFSSIFHNDCPFWERVNVSLSDEFFSEEENNFSFKGTFHIAGEKTKKLLKTIHFSFSCESFSDFPVPLFLINLFKLKYNGCLNRECDLNDFYEKFSSKKKIKEIVISSESISLNDKEYEVTNHQLRETLKKALKGKSFTYCYEQESTKHDYCYLFHDSNFDDFVENFVKYRDYYKITVSVLSLLKDARKVKEFHPRKVINQKNFL